MRFLRTVSTRRLLAIIAGFVSAIAAGAAIAVAAAGPGPVPTKTSLARAVHNALAAPAIGGVSARISFTNHLIDSSDLQGSDPILSGATGRLWLSSDHRLRLELQSDNGDAQVVVNKGAFWVYDPSSNTVYEGTLPADATATQKQTAQDRLPSIAQIQSDIATLARHANLSGAIPSDVAGRAAYTVRISPKHDGGLLGAGALAWDALKGVPLKFAVYARNDPTPVLQLKATNISFGSVPASVFNISPPSGAKVVKVDTTSTSAGAAAGARKAKAHARQKEITGAAAVAKRLPFTLVAPTKLVGLPRRSVTLLNWGGSPAALVAYGQNLGGVAVIEQPASVAKSAATNTGQAGDRRGLNLPTVSINGATGQELDTALGTMVRFTRGGVTYTVVGSVPAAAADAAARAL
ncbi:MAG TPA: hypothetical protein VMU39_02370 [Solirubrobacteraceae bacterium]|nr:hypothetical protein [Solirubrobacteraceae bacterium]